MNKQQPTKGKLWTGRILSTIMILFLLFDSTIHIIVIQPVIDSSVQLGFPIEAIQILGFVELLCLILYAIPRSSIIGAILLTGYLGGAMAIQLRIGAPLLSVGLFPIYFGAMIWGGLLLQNKVSLKRLLN